MKTPKKLPLQDDQEITPNENEATPNVTDRTVGSEEPGTSNLTNPTGQGSIRVNN